MTLLRTETRSYATQHTHTHTNLFPYQPTHTVCVCVCVCVCAHVSVSGCVCALLSLCVLSVTHSPTCCRSLSPSDPSLEISILDVFGFEEFHKNGFEQVWLPSASQRTVAQRLLLFTHINSCCPPLEPPVSLFFFFF